MTAGTATQVHGDNHGDSLNFSSGRRDGFASPAGGRDTISSVEDGLLSSDGVDANVKKEHRTPVTDNGTEDGYDLEKGPPTKANEEADEDATIDPRSVRPPNAPEPNIVTWDGPNDPYVPASSLEAHPFCLWLLPECDHLVHSENPKNWSFGKKWLITTTVSFFTLMRYA